MSTLSIHIVQPADVEAIAALLTQLNRAEGNDAVCAPAPLGTALFGEARAVPLRALVAQQGEGVIGALLYYRGYDVLTATYGTHLADFVVDETVRRQGIGKQLFAALAQQNLEEGGKWISLTVLSGNLAAQGFYKAMGMTQVAVDFFAIGEKGLTSVATLLQK